MSKSASSRSPTSCAIAPPLQPPAAIWPPRLPFVRNGTSARRHQKADARSIFRPTLPTAMTPTVRSMDVIACTELTKRFGSTTAVDRLNLRVGSGQVYGFLGPNGAGKTTTIRMLLGLISPTAGQVELLGARLPDPRATARTGSMIEEPTFYPWLTGRQNLQVLAETGGCRADGPEVARVLGLSGLSGAAAKKD